MSRTQAARTLMQIADPLPRMDEVERKYSDSFDDILRTVIPSHQNGQPSASAAPGSATVPAAGAGSSEPSSFALLDLVTPLRRQRVLPALLAIAAVAILGLTAALLISLDRSSAPISPGQQPGTISSAALGTPSISTTPPDPSDSSAASQQASEAASAAACVAALHNDLDVMRTAYRAAANSSPEAAEAAANLALQDATGNDPANWLYARANAIWSTNKTTILADGPSSPAIQPMIATACVTD